LCTEKASGKNWAVKIVGREGKSDDEKRMEIILTEIKILKVVNHQNIVNLKDIFEDQDSIYIVMENISGGELFEKIVELSHYSEKEASQIIRQVLSGVSHLHEKRIVHRDLKPENLLLSSKESNADIKITDFGLSEIFDEGKPILMTRAVGTPGYLAPEVLELLDNNIPYGKEVDLWGIGVILYILLCGFPPFYGDNDDEVYDKIVAGNWRFLSPYWDGVSDSAKDLITNLLVLDPTKRFTAAQALAHPWIAASDKNSEAHLGTTITELKKFNAKRKLKGAFLAVKAMNKMKRLFK
jgi:calcium/calmodulin-dependent protein kinase I